MANSLPDEILVEILSPVLDVEDHLFSNTSAISPFSQMSYSNSVILVVCRNWLRVCTPLLYNVVVLRSTAQAQALAFALTRNKILGQFVKKLRLEGGFGASLKKILVAAPNITDLVLSLSIPARDSAVGLVKGLTFINPTRVIIFENDVLSNFMVQQLREKLCDCMKTWTNMVRGFQFSWFSASFIIVYRSEIHRPCLQYDDEWDHLSGIKILSKY
jgi:hypothetical protein